MCAWTSQCACIAQEEVSSQFEKAPAGTDTKSHVDDSCASLVASPSFQADRFVTRPRVGKKRDPSIGRRAGSSAHASPVRCCLPLCEGVPLTLSPPVAGASSSQKLLATCGESETSEGWVGPQGRGGDPRRGTINDDESAQSCNYTDVKKEGCADVASHRDCIFPVCTEEDTLGGSNVACKNDGADDLECALQACCDGGDNATSMKYSVWAQAARYGAQNCGKELALVQMRCLAPLPVNEMSCSHSGVAKSQGDFRGNTEGAAHVACVAGSNECGICCRELQRTGMCSQFRQTCCDVEQCTYCNDNETVHQHMEYSRDSMGSVGKYTHDSGSQSDHPSHCRNDSADNIGHQAHMTHPPHGVDDAGAPQRCSP